jgi:hypothetical protein
VQKLKKLIAIFSLLVFLIPFAESEMHNFAHRNDSHCAATNLHFHKAEHHCSLCDFTGVFSGPPSFNEYCFQLNRLAVLQFFVPKKHYSLQGRDFQSLRAPPTSV